MEPVPERRVGEAAAADAPAPKRSLLERLGMALIAAVLAVLFGAVAVAAWVGGEVSLAAMAGIGALMTAWAGGITVLRG